LLYNLKYRIPGQPVQNFKGDFVEVDLSNIESGFIVSNFDQSRTFLFKVNINRAGEKMFEEPPFVISKEEYKSQGESLLRSLQQDAIDKVVLSRVKAVKRVSDLDEVFNKLCNEHQNAFVYKIEHTSLGDWIGASPEILIRGDQSGAKTIALAGTKRTEDDSVWTQKEKDEHKFVVDYIRERLSEKNLIFQQTTDCEEYLAGPVKHLVSDFEIRDSLNHGAIAFGLHPTPAVSGVPVKAALELINKIEEHERRIYSGIIGVLGERTTLNVNLRCAQRIGEETYLYLGGGYTVDSNVQDEWLETENKSQTLIRAMENS
jgi:isochorismate synthase